VNPALASPATSSWIDARKTMEQRMTTATSRKDHAAKIDDLSHSNCPYGNKKKLTNGAIELDFARTRA
jgi:hypothetical protein